MTRRSGSLQFRTLMTGRGSRYFVQTQGLPLSLKSVTNGRARYQIGRGEFAVDDAGWLIVNEDQPYTIEIASPTVVETFILWFPRGWAEEVGRTVTSPTSALLDSPVAAAHQRICFFERYSRHDTLVSAHVAALRKAVSSGEPLDDAWLEQELRSVLAGMIGAQHALAAACARAPAARAATREELWRRLNRARDFIHARCDEPLTLTDMAMAATLSPYHFLRAFAAVFGATPHDWLTECRIERAKHLLARTELPVTLICFAVGYEAIGSFSARFRRATGFSPREWRQAKGARAPIRNFREVSAAPPVIPSPAP